jgi:tRNA pseudouridine38-40 synthase
MRVKAVITYDGSQYLGFQKQTSTKKTIMFELTQAMNALNIDTEIVGSGRTDAGVHASGQVIHFNLPKYWYDLHKLKFNLNRKLYTIQFKQITPVSDDFHARFSARKRLYRYVFKTTKPSIFEQTYISYYNHFNTDLLLKALRKFKGKHNFEYFRKTGSETYTTIREIYSTRYKSYKGYHIIYFQANGFLRSQVRMMVDAAMLCATEQMTLTELQEQIDCNKKHTTKLAPAEGLYLAKILYPKENK